GVFVAVDGILAPLGKRSGVGFGLHNAGDQQRDIHDYPAAVPPLRRPRSRLLCSSASLRLCPFATTFRRARAGHRTWAAGTPTLRLGVSDLGPSAPWRSIPSSSSGVPPASAVIRG